MPEAKHNQSERIRKTSYLDYPELLKIKLKTTGNKEKKIEKKAAIIQIC